MESGDLRPAANARIFVRREFKLLVTLLVIVAALWTFLVLAEAVHKGTIQQFDDAVLLAFRETGHPEIPRGPAWLPETMRDITSLGGGTVIALFTLAVAGYLWLRNKYQPLLLLFITVIGGGLLDFGLKVIVDRGRPTIVPHFVNVDPYSFPSGHSLMSMAVYLVLAALLSPQLPDRRARMYVVAVALFLTCIIGVSRVYLGAHYPSDVLGGWALGLAWATLCWLVAWYVERRRTMRPDMSIAEQKEV
jgi:undecaprenyl-diphosphatase